MKAKPILFSAPMVRALLAGTKTQTRQIREKCLEHKVRIEHVDGARAALQEGRDHG